MHTVPERSNRFQSAGLIAGLFLGVLQALTLANAEDRNSFTGKVMRVRDGDTVVVIDRDNHWSDVRLNGIDAPEKQRKKGEGGQPYAEKSREYLSALVLDREVTVQWKKYDGFGRIVGTVYVNGEDVNLKMLEEGYAWVFTKYLKDVPAENREPYIGAEAVAQEAKRGLSQYDEPEAPWDFRRRNKERVGAEGRLQ